MLRITFILCGFTLLFLPYQAIGAETPNISVPSASFELSSPLIIYLAVLLLLISTIIIFIQRRKTKSPNYILKHQYAYFDLQSNDIFLYKRHKEDPSLALMINDLCEYKVLLNDINLLTINTEKEEPFNQDNEENLRRYFSQEQQHKMINERVRKITIVLTNKKNKEYFICLYLRKDNQRLTKIDYTTAIEVTINGCWFFNKT